MTPQRTLASALLAVLAACASDTRAPAPAASRPRDTANRPRDTSLAANTIAPLAPIGPADFVVAGVSDTMDSTAVRRVKGAPDSVWVTTANDGNQFTRWRYAGMVVTFTSDSALFSVKIFGRGVATPRGLQVGDSVSRARALYGAPRDSITGLWEYDDPRTSRGEHVIQIAIREGRVESIYVGSISD